MTIHLILSAIFSISAHAFFHDPAPTPAPTPVPSPTPAPPPLKFSEVFEYFGTQDSVLPFYRTRSDVNVYLKQTVQNDGFILAVDPLLRPGLFVSYPRTHVYEFDRVAKTKKKMWTSSLCFPSREASLDNPYVKSISCKHSTGLCEVKFGENFGGALAVKVPFTFDADGSIHFASDAMAEALQGAVPNTSDEFSDLVTADMLYVRIAVSTVTCSVQNQPGVIGCSLALQRDQNPFPRDPPWDDCLH